MLTLGLCESQHADNISFCRHASLGHFSPPLSLWLILVSNKWTGHLLVTSGLSDVEKWERSGIKSVLSSRLEASFTDASHYTFVFVLMSPPCPRSSSRRMRATFCLCGTIEPFLPWYFHNMFLQGPRTQHSYSCRQLSCAFTWCFHSCWRCLLRDLKQFAFTVRRRLVNKRQVICSVPLYVRSTRLKMIKINAAICCLFESPLASAKAAAASHRVRKQQSM